MMCKPALLPAGPGSGHHSCASELSQNTAVKYVDNKVGSDGVM